MKLSLRSKLSALTTPGVSVRSDRPIAESASVLIIPPWTKPEWLAISSVGVISTVAVPSPVSTRVNPSHAQALDGLSIAPLTSLPLAGERSVVPSLSSVARGTRNELYSSLTALSLWHRHTRYRRACHQPALLVDHVRLAEEERLLHLDHAADCSQTPFDDGPQEVDLQLDRGVPHPVLLKGGERYAHSCIGDLGDDPTLHYARAVAVLRSDR